VAQENEGGSLGSEELSVTRALGGQIESVPLLRAHVDETGGEHRSQQETMAFAVEDAIKNSHPLLVQAGTGTGKSLAYLFPLAATKVRAVIATATNQLSEQLIRHDLPQVKDTLSRSGDDDFSFALLKGRSNYVCLAKVNELQSLEDAARFSSSGENEYGSDEEAEDSLFTDDELGVTPTSALSRRAKSEAKELNTVLGWSTKTVSGDRSEAPPVSDSVWSRVSTTSSDCPGASLCPFGERCFTERARNIARQSQVIVTNHALLAQDVKAACGALLNEEVPATVFGNHQVVIVDEAHSFPESLTSALSIEVDPRSLSKLLVKAARHVGVGDGSENAETGTVLKLRNDLEFFLECLDNTDVDTPLDTLPPDLSDILASLATRLITLNSLLLDEAKNAQRAEKSKKATSITVIADQALEFARSIGTARAGGAGRVRWVSEDRRDQTRILRVAPVDSGEALSGALEGRTFIATSATLVVGNDFSPIARRLGFGNSTTLEAIDVGSPFDYPSQGMLYIPERGFPEPVGKERTEHTAAVLDELSALVCAAGGRTLALFTTTVGAQRAAERLRKDYPGLTVLAHGEAPADVLVREFAEDETSVLCATMGLWQGVSVEGGSCSLVVIDKVAFAPVDNVLVAARRSQADSEGRDGFTEVIVAEAAMSLAQGAGRLIRNRTDRGVVALLDPRIHAKNYGRVLLSSLPPFNLYTKRDIVTAALERLTGGMPPEAYLGEKKATSKRKNVPYKGSPNVRKRVPKRASETRKISKTRNTD